MPLPWENNNQPSGNSGTLPWNRSGGSPEQPSARETYEFLTGGTGRSGQLAYGPDETPQRPFQRTPESDIADEFIHNVFADAIHVMNPRNWVMAGAAILGAVARPATEAVTGQEIPEGQWVTPSGEISEDTPHGFLEGVNHAIWQGPSLPEMGQAIIEPYTGVNKFKDYAFEHPIQLALDVSIIAAGARTLVRGAAGKTYALQRARNVTAANNFSEAMRAGATAEELKVLRDIQFAEWEKMNTARGFAENVGAELPGTIRRYGTAPAAGTGNAIEKVTQRTPGQRWVDSIVDYWKGQGQGYTTEQTLKLNKSMQGLLPEDAAKFNQAFVSMQQFGYNEAVLDRLIAEGKIPQQVKSALNAWNEINFERSKHLQANMPITQEEFLRAQQRPSEIMGLEWDAEIGRLTSRQFRTRAAELEQAAADWGMTSKELPFKPVDPITIREDLKLIAEYPELFAYDEAGRMVTPKYYPHQWAQDIVNGSMREIAESQLQHGFKGELAKRTGELFRTGEYSLDVAEVLKKNIRQTASHEALYNILQETVENYGKPWVSGDPIPTGQRVIYPNGFKTWATSELEQQVGKLIEEMNLRGELSAAEERVFASEMEKVLSGDTSKSVRVGDAYLIPDEIAEHIKYHLDPGNPFLEVMTDIGGATSFWRNFVLSLRPAWQIVNETTNAMLTAIKGNLKKAGFRELETRGVKMPGSLGARTVAPEIGDSFGYSIATQQWLKKKGPIGEVLLNFNRRLHNSGLFKTGRFLGEFNQARDSFYKQTNVLSEIQREFKTAERSGVSLEAGGHVFSPAEIKQINRVGALYYDALEQIIEGSKVRGREGFMREMIGRSGEAVYSWNAMTPFQRKYLTKTIPFVGWQLFTTGFLFRLATKTPGRAWILKSMANIGKEYVNNLFEDMGIDPDTVQEWDNNSIPLYVDDESGKVMVLRANSFRLYDMLGVQDIAQTVLSHPDIRLGLGLAGVETFPDIGPVSTAPLNWGEEGATKHTLDLIGERLFGAGWNTATRLAHPYVQYGTGGLVEPEKVLIGGEPIAYDWRNTLAKYVLGGSIEEYGPYEMRERSHKDFRDGVEGALLSLDNLLQEKNEDGQPIQNRAEIQAVAETYLQRAYQLLDQTGVMLSMEDLTEDDIKNLEREQTRYENQIQRVETMLNYLISHPEGYVEPGMIKAQ